MIKLTVEVWSLPNCPRCVEAKNRLRAAGIEVAERNIEDVRSARVRDIDVLSQSAAQLSAPILRVIRSGSDRRDEFIPPEELDAWLAGDMAT